MKSRYPEPALVESENWVTRQTLASSLASLTTWEKSSSVREHLPRTLDLREAHYHSEARLRGN